MCLALEKNPPEDIGINLEKPIAQALWRIADDSAPLLAIWAKEVGYRSPEIRICRTFEDYSFTEEADEMGPRAAQLIPAFVTVANHPYTQHDDRDRTIRAIRQIDPTALDRVNP